MMVVMHEGATEEQVEAVIERMVELGFTVHRSTGVVHTVLGGVGPIDNFEPEVIEMMSGVQECRRIGSAYKLASRHFNPHGTVIEIGGVRFGGEEVVVMAGPCSVESEEQIERAAAIIAAAGGRVLRGGSLKPRQSPYAKPGLGEAGLKLLRAAADRHGLLVASEVMENSEIPSMLNYVDILQVGSRNMVNVNLLRELGKVRKPILLKRGVASTIEELLMAAEHVMAGGNYQVILCERGIRTFETYTRSTMDISAIPILHKLSHLPVFADPSHGTGRRDKVIPMARAAVAAGADGLMIEVHPDPDHAHADGAHALNAEQFSELMTQLRRIAPAVDRTVHSVGI